MQLYKIGELYNPNRTHWPETIQYNFRGGEHELVFFLQSPSRDEILAIKKGSSKIAFLFEQNILFCIYEFSLKRPIIDGDAPYSIHLVPEPSNQLGQGLW